MTHAQLQAKIVNAATARHLHVHHCGMLSSQPGFPDLVIIGRKGVLYRELKVPPDTLNSAQRLLGYTLQASGQDWATWTPADWDSGLVTERLDALC